MAFRELTFAEMDQVNGGYWHSYCYYSTGGGQVWDREWIDDANSTTSSTPTNFNGSGLVGAPKQAAQFLSYDNSSGYLTFAGGDPVQPDNVDPNISYESAGGQGWLSGLANAGNYVSAQTQHDINDAAKAIASGSSSQAAANAGIAALYSDYGLSSYIIGPIDHSYNQSNGYHGSYSEGNDIIVNGTSFAAPVLSTVNTAYAANLLAVTWDAGSTSSAAANSNHFSIIDPADKQHAIDLLNNDQKFKEFHLNGIDITSEIIKSISADTVVFTDKLQNGAAQTDVYAHTIYVANSYKSDPVGLALVLAHEGLHQSLFNVFGPHGDSVYEESLGRLVSAYAYSGLSSSSIDILRRDVVEFDDLSKVKDLSDHGDFGGLMQYVKSIYGGIPDYPIPSVYDPIKGSF